jgi:DNA-binding transcriptional LysR family regulator
LTKVGYRPAAIFGLWSTVLFAGVIAAAAGKAFIGSSDALTAIFAQALAGGAVLALVAHAMIPVALEEGGSLVVLRPSPAFSSRSIWLWPNPSFDESVKKTRQNKRSQPRF